MPVDLLLGACGKKVNLFIAPHPSGLLPCVVTTGAYWKHLPEQ